MSITQFDKIFHGTGTQVGSELCKCQVEWKFTSTAEFRIASQGVAWKALESEASIAIPQGDIKWAEWMRVARNFQLRIGLSTSKSATKDAEHTRETFDGFQRDDQEKVSKLLKQFFDVALETRDMTFKGWNWGATDFRGTHALDPPMIIYLTRGAGQDLAFLVSNKMVFEVPLSTVANSNIVKTEVSLEFSTGSSTKKGKGAPDELVEMRFYVPGSRMKGMDSEDEDAEKVEKKKKKKKETAEGEDEGSDKENDDKEGEEKEKEKEKEGSEDDEGGDEDDQNAAEQFHSLIRERSSRTSQTASGTLLISFVEVLVATPRGRYDVAMYQTFLR
jgi:structure-specific recognition protein 1